MKMLDSFMFHDGGKFTMDTKMFPIQYQCTLKEKCAAFMNIVNDLNWGLLVISALWIGIYPVMLLPACAYSVSGFALKCLKRITITQEHTSVYNSDILYSSAAFTATDYKLH